MHKKCILVLTCLLMFGNLAHRAVLCFGADGHIEIESVFHEQCGNHARFHPADQKRSEHMHIKDKHCELCVDIPLSDNYITKQSTSFGTKKSSSLKTLPRTIISVFTSDNVSTNNKRLAKLGNLVSDALLSISTVVLIV